MKRVVSWGMVVAMSAGVTTAQEALVIGECAEPGANPTVAKAKTNKPDGRELFERVWTANDERSHGGDGLGPVFNANSCIACHDQGGAGGGGALDKNVHLLTVNLPVAPRREHFQPTPVGPQPEVPQPAATELPQGDESNPFDPADDQAAPQPVVITPEQAEKQFEAALAAHRKQLVEARKRLVEQLHPDFVNATTVVVHAKGTDEKAHGEWSQRLAKLALQPNFSRIVPPNGIHFDLPPQHINGPIFTNGGIPLQLAGANSFPMLTEFQAKLGNLQAQANPMASFAIPFQGMASIQRSQRNTTALWGSGVIDRIPAEAIEALAAKQKKEGGRISGRPHRLADGSLGRFGWKAQKGSLEDFTIAACANELGLEVPGAKQATVAYQPDYEAKGLDLDEKELDTLVDYIAGLPVPTRKVKRDTVADLSTGHELFASIGCADCHVEDIGEAKGVFTDLLLHDMGPGLGSVGSYGVPMTPEPDPQDVPVASAGGEKAKPVPPTSREWRTPPLWGVGSSAPYLHDGRAKTLEQAIAFHGGEAAESRLRFLLLKPAEQKQLIGFLDSLVAPETVASRE